MVRKSGKPDLRWGGWGGGRSYGANCIRQALPPPPTPPHKGEGSAPCASQPFCVQLNGIRFTGPIPKFVCVRGTLILLRTEVLMPNDVKIIVSAVALIVAAILAYWSGSPIRPDFSTYIMITAVFMVVAMWIFPEAGVKKGDKRKAR